MAQEFFKQPIPTATTLKAMLETIADANGYSQEVQTTTKNTFTGNQVDFVPTENDMLLNTVYNTDGTVTITYETYGIAPNTLTKEEFGSKVVSKALGNLYKDAYIKTTVIPVKEQAIQQANTAEQTALETIDNIFKTV